MRSFTIKASGAVAISVGLLTAIPAVAAPILFNVGGSDAASIGATVAAFRLALGDPNNANTQGPSPPNYAGSAALLTAFDMQLDRVSRCPCRLGNARDERSIPKPKGAST